MKRLIVLMAIGIVIASFTSVAWAAKPIKMKAVQFVNVLSIFWADPRNSSRR